MVNENIFLILLLSNVMFSCGPSRSMETTVTQDTYLINDSSRANNVIELGEGNWRIRPYLELGYLFPSDTDINRLLTQMPDEVFGIVERIHYLGNENLISIMGISTFINLKRLFIKDTGLLNLNDLGQIDTLLAVRAPSNRISYIGDSLSPGVNLEEVDLFENPLLEIDQIIRLPKLKRFRYSYSPDVTNEQLARMMDIAGTLRDRGVTVEYSKWTGELIEGYDW